MTGVAVADGFLDGVVVVHERSFPDSARLEAEGGAGHRARGACHCVGLHRTERKLSSLLRHTRFSTIRDVYGLKPSHAESNHEPLDIRDS